MNYEELLSKYQQLIYEKKELKDWLIDLYNKTQEIIILDVLIKMEEIEVGE